LCLFGVNRKTNISECKWKNSKNFWNGTKRKTQNAIENLKLTLIITKQRVELVRYKNSLGKSRTLNSKASSDIFLSARTFTTISPTSKKGH